MISSFGRGFDSLQLHKLKSKAAVFSVALLFVYLNTFSFQKTFYNISISSLDSRPLKSAHLRNIVRKQYPADFFNKPQKSPHGSFEVVCGGS